MINSKHILALGKLFCRSVLCFSSFRRFPPLLLNLVGSFAFFWTEKHIHMTNITTWTDDCIKCSTTKIMRIIHTSSSKYRVQFSRHLATPSKSSLWSSKYFSRVLTSASCWLRSSSVKSSVKSRHAQRPTLFVTTTHTVYTVKGFLLILYHSPAWYGKNASCCSWL